MSETEEIRRQYETGQLDPIKEDLGRFIAAHRTRILQFRSDQERQGMSLTCEDAVKSYLLKYRSINPAQEIKEQLEEIRKEKWIRGILTGCSPDEQTVAGEWARSHSAAWREHRVSTILYVFERDKDRYLGLLQS